MGLTLDQVSVKFKTAERVGPGGRRPLGGIAGGGMSRSFRHNAVFCAACALSRRIRVKELASHFDGKVSIYAKNLETGATYDLGGDNRVNTASTIKLPILIGVYHGRAGGPCEMDRHLRTDASKTRWAGRACCRRCRTDRRSRCAIWSAT